MRYETLKITCASPAMATDPRNMEPSYLLEDVLKFSFQWLSFQLSEEDQAQLVSLLRDPVEAEHWRHQLIVQLTAPPVIYCAVVNSCLSITSERENVCNFQYLFRTLARKGVFLDDCDDMIITETVLSTQHPFNMLAHQITINAIMKLYVLTHVSIHSVISEVKRVTFFTASKELPNSCNEALLLWVNKISNHNVHKMKGLNRAEESLSHSINGNVLQVVRDGQSLASLLNFYLPSSIKWNGFQFSSLPLPEDKCLHNLMMVKTIVSSNTSVQCHFDPHLVLLSAHVTLNSTTLAAIELNVFVFLSSLFLYFKQYVSEQPVKQEISNVDSTTKPFTAKKLAKRKDLQKGMQLINKPSLGYTPVCISREGLTHTVSDSSLCAHHTSTSNSASSVSLIDFSKDLSGRVKCHIGDSKSKQQITACSENLNTGQFEMHTSLRIKRPSSGHMTKECFVNSMPKSVSLQDTDKSTGLLGDTFESGMFSGHEQNNEESFVTCSNNNGNQQLQSTAIIAADHASYCWLVKALSAHGVTLEADGVADNKEKVITADVQRVSVPMTCNYQKYYMEDDDSVASHGYQISSSKGSVRVGNITTLKVNSTPSKPSTVGPKFSSDSVQNSNDNVADITHIIDKTCITSPHDYMDNQIIRSQDEPANNASEGECEENTELQSSPVTTYMATPEDIKIIAGACYEYVMDMMENRDTLGLTIEDDNQPYEGNEVLYDLDEELVESAEKGSDLPAAGVHDLNNNEDMQCLAMACYETIMDMLRSGKVHSADCSDLEGNSGDDKPVYYLDVEPSGSYELPLYTHSPLPSVSTGDTQQHSHHEKTAPEVFPFSDKAANQPTTDFQPLVVQENTTVDVDSVDSLVQCSEQANGDLEICNKTVATTLKVVDKSKKSVTNGISSDNLCQSNSPVSNRPFAAFIDISDSEYNEEHMKVLESRRQKIKMQLIERDKARSSNVKKKSAVHKPKNLLPPQNPHPAEKDLLKQLQATNDILTKSPQHSVTASQEDHILHFTLGSLQLNGTPQIINIPSTAMTTVLPAPSPLPSATTAIDPVVKGTRPIPIPYTGPLCYVQPSIKSNKKIILNAISHTCLAGPVNDKSRQETIKIVEDSAANQFLVLFRDHVGRKFRGIYSFDDKEVLKIFGAGPKLITNSMISRVYKYNSGSREFYLLPSRSISMSVDAFTLHDYIWVVAKNRKHVH